MSSHKQSGGIHLWLTRDVEVMLRARIPLINSEKDVNSYLVSVIFVRACFHSLVNQPLMVMARR